MPSELKTLPLLARILAAVGTLNWGVVGLFQNNLVELVAGRSPAVVQALYILIGLSGLYMLMTTRRRPLF